MALYKHSNFYRQMITIFTSRVLWTSMAILAQLILLVVIISFFREHSIYIEVLLMFISALMVVWILNSRKSPAYQLAWIILILIFPVFGGMIYLLLGGNRTTYYARHKLIKVDHHLTQFTSEIYDENHIIDKLRKQNRSFANQAVYIKEYTLMPPFQHSHTMYFPNGESMFEQFLIELAKAEHYIFLEYFIIAEGLMWQKILDILKEKAAQGVDVRVIYDDIATLRRLPANYPKELRKMGIKCAVYGPFHPILSMRFNNRDHRKIAVIDGHTAFTGGINLADEYINVTSPYGYWKDTAVMIYGQAAFSFTLLFLSMWNYLSGIVSHYEKYRCLTTETIQSDGFVQVLHDAPFDSEYVSETVFRNMIGQALESIYIFTPYLVASNEIISAITNAAKRGVQVHIIIPGVSDDKWFVQAVGRASYEELITAGVNIYEFTPGFLHSKTVLVDNNQAFVGTVNLDYRSMYLNFECGVMLYETSSIKAISQDMNDTINQHCRKITYEEVIDTPLWRRFYRIILKVFAPLM